MKPMNISEAVAWAEENKKPICRPIWIHYNYIIPNEEGELVWDDGSIGKIFLTEDFTANDWQPWEEPREYVGYWEAIKQILTNDCSFKCDFPEASRNIYYALGGEVVYHIGEDFSYVMPHLPGSGMIEAKWYEVAIPIVEGDSTDESQEEVHKIASTCPKCGKYGYWKGYNWECRNVMCKNEWSECKGPEEPVFGLTYEEAKIECVENWQKVTSEKMVSRFWLRHGPDIISDKFDIQSNPWGRSYMSGQKWRIVTD